MTIDTTTEAEQGTTAAAGGAGTAAPSAGTGTGTGRRSRLRLLRWIVVAVLAVALAAGGLVGVSLLASPPPAGGLNDTGSAGHAAIAQLVRDEQVRTHESVRFRDTVGRAPGATVVVDRLAELPARAWQGLVAAGPRRIVLFSPRQQDLRRLGVEVTGAGSVTSPLVAPECDDPAAVRSGRLRLPSGARSYEATSPVVQCYPNADLGHFLLMVRVGDTEIVVMPDVASNSDLPVEGNAALAMQVLGANPLLVWWTVDSADPTMLERGNDGGNGVPFPSLLPPGWIHAVWLAVLALVVVAVWRGRRLGPILVEDLPVVVSAAETVEGHGRLYGRLGARDTAASHLRTAAIGRLARRLGHATDPEALAQGVADRTGRPYGEVRALLDGPSPTSDADLVTLKRQLDALEQEARRP